MDNSAEMDNVNSYNLHRHSKPTGRVPGFEASFLRGQTVEMYRHVMHYGPKRPFPKANIVKEQL